MDFRKELFGGEVKNDSSEDSSEDLSDLAPSEEMNDSRSQLLRDDENETNNPI